MVIVEEDKEEGFYLNICLRELGSESQQCCAKVGQRKGWSPLIVDSFDDCQNPEVFFVDVAFINSSRPMVMADVHHEMDKL